MNGLECALYVIRGTESSSYFAVPDPAFLALDPRLVKRCIDHARTNFSTQVTLHSFGNGTEPVTVFSARYSENGCIIGKVKTIATYSKTPSELDEFWNSAIHIGTLPLSSCHLAKWAQAYSIESSKK